MKILKLDKRGLPREWVTVELAATLMAKEKVIWSLGDLNMIMLGGINNLGQRSKLEIPSIIAVDGDIKSSIGKISLSNETLFRRDCGRCMYCGQTFSHQILTRDHVIPRGQGGLDVWTNVVASCKRCNNHKACRTPEEAGMPLLAIPFEPNWFEFLFLQNRKILGDQMDYLKNKFSDHRDWEHIAA